MIEAAPVTSPGEATSPVPPKQAPSLSSRVLARMHREERWLLLLCATALLVTLSAGVGMPTFGGVFSGYFRSFSGYFAVLFFVSRLHAHARTAWQPVSDAARRAKAWGFGADEQTPPALGWEGWILPARARAHDARHDVLSNDLLLVRVALTLFATLTLYTNVKVRIPYLGGLRGTDAMFQRWDEAIFGRGFASSLEAWARDSSGVRDFLANAYMHDYLWFVLLLVLLYFRRDRFAMRWLVVSACCMYIVAILITALFPAVGPCFVDPMRFAWVRPTSVGNAQNMLVHFYVEGRGAVGAGQSLVASPFTRIAAFPSLHVGHMVLLVCVAARTCPLYAVYLVWASACTFVATVAFGWHYAVDGVAGIALAVAITEALRAAMLRWDSDEATATD